MIPRDYFIFPSDFLGFSPNETGWWKRESKDYIWLRNFLQEKYATDLADFTYGGGYAISEGHNRLTIKSDKLKKGDIIMLRFMNTKSAMSSEDE